MSGLPTFEGPASKYGASFLSSPTAAPGSVLPAAGGPGSVDARHVLSPQDGLFWALIVGGLAVGFMYASTTVRVGPVSASVAAGKA